MDTVEVSPLELKLEDKVYHHGAVLQVKHIIETEDITTGEKIFACISQLVGEELGSIPRGFFDPKERMVSQNLKWAEELPPGLYWNIQGNRFAKVQKII